MSQFHFNQLIGSEPYQGIGIKRYF